MNGRHRAVRGRPGALISHGWDWRRNHDGSVTVWPGAGEDVTYSAAEWARIVAAMAGPATGADPAPVS